MFKMAYAEIHDILNRAKLDQLPKLDISILRNVVVEGMIPYLKFLAYEMGFRAEIRMGDYDNIVQESLAGGSGIVKKDTDCILIFSKIDGLSWSLARNFASLEKEEIQNQILNIHKTITNVLGGIRNQTNGMILWCGFELPLYPSLGIGDGQIASGQSEIIAELNNFLRSSLRNIPNAYYVDLNLCLARVGGRAFYDERYWHIGRAPYSREGLAEIASEAFKYIRAGKGKNKKCLVLDCDNVLWGGIIGEDGLSGIKLSKVYPGSPYTEFQQEVLNLYSRGIILALCSKNNDKDVWEVFRTHPDMVLKENHIAAAEINWEDKATNLKKIAINLNIGLESMVFIDDSEFEVNLVRDAIPEITVIHLPKDKSVEYRNILASCGLFDTLALSAEDRERGDMYRLEALRKKMQNEAPDLETYLRSLEMVVELNLVDDYTLPRVAQLTQKTNQFNLTTRRYSEADIRAFMQAEEVDVLTLRLSDKFGDSGLVGVCILKRSKQTALIDTLLLSCRVLGRGVEDVFIAQALKLARQRKCESVIAEYYQTAKNEQVKNFYPRRGFESIPRSSDKEGWRYCISLSGPLMEEPSYFKEIRSFLNE
ncbi:MAG TPA: HAD-IIIC family phosphatase [bacterium]|nr:HAD-IIIC family phosphatase [bacterium]